MERRRARWLCNPKGIVSSSPAESARLPWVSVRAIFNGVVSHLRHRATTPLADTTRFSQGSLADSANLGFGAESLWDSSLEFPKGIEAKGAWPSLAGGITTNMAILTELSR